MLKKTLMLAAAMAMVGTAGAQATTASSGRTINGDDFKYQIMSCYRPTPGEVVKCDTAAQMTNGQTSIIHWPLDLKIIAADGRTYRSYALVMGGNKTLTIAPDINYPQVTLAPTPTIFTYLFKIPQTVSEARSIMATNADGQVMNVPITIPNTAAAVTLYTVPAGAAAATTFTLSGCKSSGKNQWSCSTVIPGK